MKKLKFLIILVLGIFLIPITSNAASDVYIEGVDVLEKSDNTEVLTPASFSGLNINFDVKFTNKDDYIKYKVVIVNKGKKDYKITNTTKFKEGDYIKYDYSFTSSNIVKAGSEQTMTIKISYDNLVPEEKMNADGTFTETKNMVVSLAQGNSIINNPKTSSTIITLLIVMTIIVCSASIIGIHRRNKVTTMLLVLGISFLALPVTIMAIESIQIKVNSKVTIIIEKDVCVYDYGLTATEYIPRGGINTEMYSAYMNNAYKYKARIGMTARDFMNSSYFNQIGHETPANQEIFNRYDGEKSNAKKFFDDGGRNCTAEVIFKDAPSRDVSSFDEKLYFCDEAIYRYYCDE